MALFDVPSRLARLAPRFAPGTTAKVDSTVTTALDWAIDHAWNDAVARAEATEGADVDDRVRNLWTSFAKELAAVGAATGGMAAVPAVGTASSLAASAAEFGWFTKRAAELVLTVAALHGRVGTSVEERRAWVLAILLYGKKANKEFERMAAEVSGATGDVEVTSLPLSALVQINGSLGRRAATRYAARRAAIAAGQAVPFGIGAVIGGTANYWATRRLARHADRFFRRLPQSRVGTLDSV